MTEPGHHGLEAFLHLLLAGGGNPGERAPVKRVHGREHLETPFVVPKLPGQLVEAFVGFGAAVGKEDLAGGQMAHDLCGQASLRLVVIKVRNVDQALRLLHQRLGDLRVRVAQGADRDAAAQVQVTLAINIPQLAPAAAHKGQVEAPVARDDVLVEKLFD